MEKKKTATPPMSEQEKADRAKKRDWIASLRKGIPLTVAMAAALEMGNGKAPITQEMDRKIEPKEQVVTAPVQSILNEQNPEVAPDTIVMPGFEKDLGKMDDKPAGINIPTTEYAAPQIIQPEEKEVPVDFEGVTQFMEDEHYEQCNSFIADCDEVGYEKDKDNVKPSDRGDLVDAAAGLETSRVLKDDILPALGGANKIMEGVSNIYDNVANRDISNPIVRAKIERDSKEAIDTSKKYSKNVFGSIAQAQKQIKTLSSLAAEAKANNGELSNESSDKLISKNLKYARNFTKDYERKNPEKILDSTSLAQKKMMDKIKGGRE